MIEIEITFLSIIFIIQLIAVINIVFRIIVLRNIFKVLPEFDKELKQFIYSGKNKIKKTIIETINKYIQGNEGGVVDFHILKDIIDRNVDTIDEEISNKLPTPLYLGLAGTMIGIIIGLFFIDFSSPSEGGDEMAGISPLIDGVKYAMSVSVIGLIFTTALAVLVYKEAKAKVNEGKNSFLSLIQTELLPTLIKSDDVAIQELSKELRNFSIKTPQVINVLSDNTKTVKESIEKEIILLNQIKELDIKKLSKSNVETFKILSGMMDDFEAFPKYYNELNNSLGNTILLNNNLKSLVDSTQNVNTILENVKSILETGNDSVNFFNQHIKSFDQYNEAVSLSVSLTNQAFETAMEQLKVSVTAQIESMNFMIADFDSKLNKSFDNSIQKFTEAYQNNLPKFQNLEYLEQLKQLPETNNRIQKSNTLLQQQIEVLKNLTIQLPDNVNLNLKKEKNAYFYYREALMLLTTIGVLSIAVVMAYRTFKGILF